MKRVLTKRRRQRRVWGLIAVLNAVSALSMVTVDDPTMWTGVAAVINGVVIGAFVFLILFTGHMDFLRKSNTSRYRWFQQSARLNRKLLNDLKGANATNASLVDHVRRYRLLVSGQRQPDAVKEWEH